MKDFKSKQISQTFWYYNKNGVVKHILEKNINKIYIHIVIILIKQSFNFLETQFDETVQMCVLFLILLNSTYEIPIFTLCMQSLKIVQKFT